MLGICNVSFGFNGVFYLPWYGFSLKRSCLRGFPYCYECPRFNNALVSDALNDFPCGYRKYGNACDLGRLIGHKFTNLAQLTHDYNVYNRARYIFVGHRKNKTCKYFDITELHV